MLLPISSLGFSRQEHWSGVPYLRLHGLKAFFKQQRPNSTSQGGLKESFPAEGAVLCPRTPEPSGHPVLWQHTAAQVLLDSLRPGATFGRRASPLWSVVWPARPSAAVPLPFTLRNKHGKTEKFWQPAFPGEILVFDRELRRKRALSLVSSPKVEILPC